MKQRVASGVSLVIFLAAIVLFNDTCPAALNVAISLISVLAVYEIILALGLSKNHVLIIPSLLLSAAIPLMQLVAQSYGIKLAILQEGAYFLYTVVIFSALILYHKFITFREVGVIYSMSLMIPSSLQTIISLRTFGGEHGMFYVIIGIFSAWIADTGAYFAGSRWGKHKLCPDISPKKTVEGVIGGFVLNIIAMWSSMLTALIFPIYRCF